MIPVSIEDPEFARASIQAAVECLIEIDNEHPDQVRAYVESVIRDYDYDRRVDGDA